tara:strand:- start:365 stop:586 length:222 start_codon:yes stop_codon:yes gene_type:complete
MFLMLAKMEILKDDFLLYLLYRKDLQVLLLMSVNFHQLHRRLRKLLDLQKYKMLHLRHLLYSLLDQFQFHQLR